MVRLHTDHLYKEGMSDRIAVGWLPHAFAWRRTRHDLTFHGLGTPFLPLRRRSDVRRDGCRHFCRYPLVQPTNDRRRPILNQPYSLDHDEDKGDDAPDLLERWNSHVAPPCPSVIAAAKVSLTHLRNLSNIL